MGGRAVSGHRLRAVGAACLAALPLAVAAGALETFLSERGVAASAGDVLYGAALHALAALLVVLAARLVFWRARASALRWVAVGGVLALELGAVVPFWVTRSSLLPPVRTASGLLLTVGLALVGLALSSLVGWRGARRAQGGEASGRAGWSGLILALLLLGGLAVAAVRAAPRAPEVGVHDGAGELERPDLCILMIDTLRRDHVSYFGYERSTTPQLDRFLSQSFVFSAAETPSIWTIPSVASLFTGLYPSAHGAVGNDRYVLVEQGETLAEMLQGLGYQTGAFVSNPIIGQRNGFAQGFATFLPDWPPWWFQNGRTILEELYVALHGGAPLTSWRSRIDAELAPRLDAWLEQVSPGPRFAYVHFISPHDPYRPPREHRDAVAPGAPPGPVAAPDFVDYQADDACGDWECIAAPPELSAGELRGMIANYDGEIRYMDEHLGRVLAVLRRHGMLRDGHVLLVSDHGEEFFDHRGWAHGNSIYEEVSGGLAAYRPPGGLDRARVIPRPVALIDVQRTVCERLGLPLQPAHQGRTIPELAPEPAAGGDWPVLCECPPYLYALRLRDWKLIRRGPVGAPAWRLYDLASDPGETRDLAAAEADTLAHLRAYLEALVAGLERSALTAAGVGPDLETVRRLRALGYIQ